jgi:hypothetical protein
MIATLQDAKAKLESEGLYVSCRDDRLWIAANVRDAGDGIMVADEACALIRTGDAWSAIFPASRPFFPHEMPGTLPDLVATIAAVFAEKRRAQIQLGHAFRQVVSDPDRFLMGRKLAPA